MYSYLMAENHTDFPAITICTADGVIFQDIPKNDKSDLKQLTPGSVRLEIYNNFMKQEAVVWVPVTPFSKAKLMVFSDHIQLIPL
ncbi:MAG: hypothetical protein KIG65_07255 [Eubacteriales bacterium]|nr:hypothetical protein [Eubacteriales bacterium]